MQDIIRWVKWFFSKTYPAGRVLGIPLRIHLPLLVFLGIMIPVYLAKGMYPFIGYMMFLGVLYFSITAHEFGHAWGNRLVGGGTDQIILTPIGGVAVGYGADSSPKTELIVVGLGPAVTVIFAAIGAVFYYGVLALNLPDRLPFMMAWLIIFFFQLFFYINLGLGLFNLLTPIFPLDCAKLLRGGLSLYFNPQKVTLRLTQIGIVFAVLALILWFGGISVPGIPEGSILFGIIAIIGIQACLHEQTRIKFQEVYRLSDNWGGRQVYYDSDIMSRAKRTARADLGPLGFLVPKGGSGATVSGPGSKPKRKGTIKKSERLKAASKKASKAKVIDISLDRDPDQISDPNLLKDMMQAAAEQEDYKLAAKIKKRLREIDGS